MDRALGVEVLALSLTDTMYCPFFLHGSSANPGKTTDRTRPCRIPMNGCPEPLPSYTDGHLTKQPLKRRSVLLLWFRGSNPGRHSVPVNARAWPTPLCRLNHMSSTEYCAQSAFEFSSQSCYRLAGSHQGPSFVIRSIVDDCPQVPLTIRPSIPGFFHALLGRSARKA